MPHPLKTRVKSRTKASLRKFVRNFTGHRQSTSTGKMVYCYIGKDGSAVGIKWSPEQMGFTKLDGVWTKDEQN